MNLENNLRRALQREAPPAGFAQRVVAAAGGPKPASLLAPQRTLWWKAKPLVFANAFALTVAVLAAGIVYQRHEEQRAQDAGRQLVTALNLTQATLQKTQERIRRIATKPVI